MLDVKHTKNGCVTLAQKSTSTLPVNIPNSSTQKTAHEEYPPEIAFICSLVSVALPSNFNLSFFIFSDFLG